jgi:hypothetical protein
LGLGGVVVTLLACGDLSGPPRHAVSLSIVPVFDANGLFASNADQLRIRVQRDSSGTFKTVRDTTVAIDADGNVDADINVVLFQSPQTFRVLLDAVRATDGAVLFAGVQEVVVTSGSTSTAQEVSIPVSYSGPRGARVVLTPADTVVGTNRSFTFKSTVFDSKDAVVSVPVGYYLLNPADASKLTINRLTGAATTTAQTGDVLVLALTADSLRDTAHVFVGSVAQAVRITPGSANVALGQSLSLNGAVLDGAGNPLAGQTVTWASRSAGVATVNGAGLVTTVSGGRAVIVATSGAIADSIHVMSVPTGYAVVASTSRGRSFVSAAVNDTLSLDLIADMANSGEKLGSYGATLTWDPAKIQLDTLVEGNFGGTFAGNLTLKSSGQATFVAANAAGAAGQPILARARFKAVATGNAAPSVTVTEMSAPSPSFTDLFRTGRVTVSSGSVTVR